MIEDEIRTKGLIPAPAALDAAVLRHARKQVERRVFWLDNRLLRFAAGYIPFWDWGLIAAALFRGERIRIRPIMPGLVPFMPAITIGDTK